MIQLERQAVSIDWPTLARQRPRLVGGAATLVLNDRGDYLSWELPMLTRLDGNDWRNLVTTLGARQQTTGATASITPVIEHGEQLLSGPPAN